MKLRAWDGEKFRYDFMIPASGKIYTTVQTGNVLRFEEVSWEVSESLGDLHDMMHRLVFFGDIISSGSYRYPIRNTVRTTHGNQWSSGPDTKTLGLTLPLGTFEIIGNKWQNPEIWKELTWND